MQYRIKTTCVQISAIAKSKFIYISHAPKLTSTQLKMAVELSFRRVLANFLTSCLYICREGKHSHQRPSRGCSR